MSDLDVLREMLTRAGVYFSEDGQGDERRLNIPSHHPSHPDDLGRSGPNRGYFMFESIAGFDKDGRLLWWGTWE